jgi:uncharacterized membrane protein YciS (DUF1049 family)
MPWRLLVFIVIGAVFLGFIGFNLENRCDVSFGFYVFSQVPVFLSTLFAFVLGLALAFPLAVSFRSASRRKKKAEPLLPGGSVRKKDRAGEAAAPLPPGGDHGIG